MKKVSCIIALATICLGTAQAQRVSHGAARGSGKSAEAPATAITKTKTTSKAVKTVKPASKKKATAGHAGGGVG